jgi:hypothetical protein
LWRWLEESLRRIYSELDSSAEVGSVTVVFWDDDQIQMVSYSIGRGDREITRLICPDPDAIGNFVLKHSVDATPGEFDTLGGT